MKYLCLTVQIVIKFPLRSLWIVCEMFASGFVSLLPKRFRDPYSNRFTGFLYDSILLRCSFKPPVFIFMWVGCYLQYLLLTPSVTSSLCQTRHVESKCWYVRRSRVTPGSGPSVRRFCSLSFTWTRYLPTRRPTVSPFPAGDGDSTCRMESSSRVECR